MFSNRNRIIAFILAFSVLVPTASLLAKDPAFKMMDIGAVSRYDEDRLAYQQVQKWIDPTLGTEYQGLDDSVASLLIIQKSKMYLIKDGYDDPKNVSDAYHKLILDNTEFKEEDLWANKLNGKPDYVRVTDRRVELMKNFDEEYVSKNFGERYIKVRDALLQRHVAIFEQLMRNRKESELTIVRNTIPQPAYIGAPDEGTKYFMSVIAKSNDGRVYYAEDADGDGITETFWVHIPDNFNWGYKSGPNVIFIYKNKEKDIEAIIGKITKESYYGTADEEKNIIETFPKDQDIIDSMINEIRDEPRY